MGSAGKPFIFYHFSLSSHIYPQRGRENTSRYCKARVGKDKADNSGCHRDESTLEEMDEQYEHQKMFWMASANKDVFLHCGKSLRYKGWESRLKWNNKKVMLSPGQVKVKDTYGNCNQRNRNKLLNYLELENHFIKREKWEGLLVAKSGIFHRKCRPHFCESKKVAVSHLCYISNFMDTS